MEWLLADYNFLFKCASKIPGTHRNILYMILNVLILSCLVAMRRPDFILCCLIRWASIPSLIQVPLNSDGRDTYHIELELDQYGVWIYVFIINFCSQNCITSHRTVGFLFTKEFISFFFSVCRQEIMFWFFGIIRKSLFNTPLNPKAKSERDWESCDQNSSVCSWPSMHD